MLACREVKIQSCFESEHILSCPRVRAGRSASSPALVSFGSGSEGGGIKILPPLHQRSLPVRHPNKAILSFQRAKCEVIKTFTSIIFLN